MRILIITQKIDESDDVLGFFISWVRAIAKRVDRVDVICLAKGPYDLPENVRVFSLGKEKEWPKIIQGLMFYIRALRLLPRTDGVFVHMAPEYVKALYPLNAIFKKPIVMWYAHIKVSSAAKWALNHVDRVLTPSKESFEFDTDKAISTGHGIDTDVFRPMDSEPEADVLAISRISKVKKIETLIESAKILREKGITPSINIYGRPARPEDDAYLAGLKDLVEKYGLRNLSWKDAVPNRQAPAVYAKHRLFVRMQGGGGFGKTELEAMSMGVPAIVPTEVYKKDLGEFAKDLYFREDDANMLADRIEKALAWDESKKMRYAALVRHLVAGKHNVENVAKEVVKLIKQCAE